MGLMKEKFIQQREEESYQEDTIQAHYSNLLLLSEEQNETQEVINELNTEEDVNRN
tara:strand:+ start:10951 stop:11118 length:168 start_codon:yes stop_codon:yes gene_type:complete